MGEELEVELNKHIVQILDKIYFQRHETSGKCASQERPALMMRLAPLQVAKEQQGPLPS